MATLKEKLKALTPMAGTHISLSEPVIGELIGGLGYDFVWIDTEHTAIDYHTLELLLMGARAGGVSAIVRVPWNDAILAKRVLEQGPDGIIFPMVNTKEEADRAMKSCLYPPEGNRGFGPIRAARYGLDDMNEYIGRSNRELCRFIQIETVQAVKNLPEIVKNPYIDGYFFGPCDLSGSIGELNRVFEPNTMALIDEAVEVLRAAGKPIGVSTGSSDPEILRFWRSRGVNILSSCGDFSYILQGARDNLSNLRKILG